MDSPFDLTLGSTNYAARLGKAVRSNASAWYDPTTKVTTTNWSAYASVRFAKPYHGATHASLQFKGEERELDSYSFEIGESRRRIGGPTKTEVKFVDEHAMFAILRSAVKKALGRGKHTHPTDDPSASHFAQHGYDTYHENQTLCLRNATREYLAGK